MSQTKHFTHKLVCNCHQYAPPLRVLRSVEFNSALAEFYADLGLSGDGIVDWVLHQLFEVRQGWLYDYNREHIDIDQFAHLTDVLFGMDERRFMNRYLERAKLNFRNRLHMRVVFPVMMMHFAREVYLSAHRDDC